jgi:acyl-CoA reductase-like NAD-dependent aldehyde dehydrogenase
MWKMTPALAAGNTVVIKVSKETSLTALLMGDLITAAGLPPGVVNILTGPGKSLGDAMVEHPDVDKVSVNFTVNCVALGCETVLSVWHYSMQWLQWSM